MNDAPSEVPTEYLVLTADIVSAFVSNNSVPVSELTALLTSVHAALSGLGAGELGTSAEDTVEKPTPAQIKKSITADSLISFEDGKPYKTLRRHLALRGLTPEDYRGKYGLPRDYPMTSASYSEQRSKLALALGLGQQRRGQGKTTAKDAEPQEAVLAAAAEAKPKRAGRPRKAAAGE